MLDNYAKSELKSMLNEHERILWQGRPDKKAFILRTIFNTFLPVVIVWGLIDGMFIGKASVLDEPITIPFFLLHLTPVWVYLGSVLFASRRYKHTEYIVSDRGVYLSRGLFAYECRMKPFIELTRVSIRRSIIDQFIGTGDIVLTGSNVDDLSSEDKSNLTNSWGADSFAAGTVLASIKDYKMVFELIKKLQKDIYTDTMYPNDLRPETNHGYETKYQSK